MRLAICLSLVQSSRYGGNQKIGNLGSICSKGLHPASLPLRALVNPILSRDDMAWAVMGRKVGHMRKREIRLSPSLLTFFSYRHKKLNGGSDLAEELPPPPPPPPPPSCVRRVQICAIFSRAAQSIDESHALWSVVASLEKKERKNHHRTDVQRCCTVPGTCTCSSTCTYSSVCTDE